MTYTVHEADVLEALRAMPDNSFHGCLTDPPYGLTKDGGKTGFMGHTWDRGVPPAEVWREVLRVLKPGAHLLAFGGPRTFHRLTCAIEDAGFEVRDVIAWMYGCLSEDTEVLIDGRWEHYSKAVAGRLALCYDVANGTYSWKPIAERVEYDYDDTAYRITSERTDQIVSRNHRCIVDRGAGWQFSLAEEAAREPAVVVPVLQDVQGLLCQLRDTQSSAGVAEQDVLEGVRGGGNRAEGARAGVANEPQGVPAMRDLRQGCTAPAVEGGAGDASVLLRCVQRRTEGEGADAARPQGPCSMDGGVASLVHGEDDGPAQSGVEGRGNLLRLARESCRGEVRAMPRAVPGDGTEGRLRDGAPAGGRASDGPPPSALRGGAPHGPQPEEQRAREPGSLRDELGSQEVRGEGLTASDLAVIEPVHYTGKVWCLRVPTGAFVARRNGKVFVTGNSGFPKSHDVSKAIDREAGAVREVVGKRTFTGKAAQDWREKGGDTFNAAAPSSAGCVKSADITAPSTEAARQWSGYGSALKPAYEPVILARKPLTGTLAANCQEHGCGGLAIDACRIGSGADKGVWPLTSRTSTRSGRLGDFVGQVETNPNIGRWPANVILDEEAGAALDAQSGERPSGSRAVGVRKGLGFHGANGDGGPAIVGSTGGASRFFYCAKPSRTERDAGLEEFDLQRAQKLNSGGIAARREAAGLGQGRNTHPTVKPLALARYLARLILPPVEGAQLLVPFCGSGSEVIGALQAGWSHVEGIDSWDVAVRIARARLAHHAANMPKQLTLGGAA